MPIFPPEIDPLFSQYDLGTLLKNQIGKMENRVDELADDLFLSIPAQDLIDDISQDAYLQALVLLPEQGISHNPIEISGGGVVPGETFRYSIEIPYTGASGLFNHEPATFDLDKPSATLNSHSMQGSIILRRVATTDVPDEELRASFAAEVAKVQKYIGYQALEIAPYNASLKSEAERIVNGRRERLPKARRIAAALGHPLHRRADAPGLVVRTPFATIWFTALGPLTLSRRRAKSHAPSTALTEARFAAQSTVLDKAGRQVRGPSGHVGVKRAQPLASQLADLGGCVLDHRLEQHRALQGTPPGRTPQLRRLLPPDQAHAE